jgi:probable HAF family extracellular repeat protein
MCRSRKSTGCDDGAEVASARRKTIRFSEAGQIVGRRSAGNNRFHAFEFLDGNTIDLGTLGGANGEALAINKHGQIVGDSDTTEGPAHAFIFDHSRLKDLGTLPGLDNASYARGINNSGDIVGESDSADQKRAFLYSEGQLVELDKLAESLSEAGFNSLDVAFGINDKGWIVGYGTTSANLTAGFVAMPEGRRNQRRVSGVQQPQEQSQAERPKSESQTKVSLFLNRMRGTMTFFIRGCPLAKAIGWKPVITATASDRVFQRIGDPTKTATGFGPTAAGTGTQTSLLAGQPTIMADGQILVGPDGAGFPAINGLRPGSPGGKAMKTLAGRLSHPKQTTRAMEYHPGPTRIMVLDRRRTPLSVIHTGTSRATPATSSPLGGTFRSSVRSGTLQTL